MRVWWYRSRGEVEDLNYRAAHRARSARPSRRVDNHTAKEDPTSWYEQLFPLKHLRLVLPQSHRVELQL